MIGVLAKHAVLEAGQLVLAALKRSVSRTQAAWVSPASIEAGSWDFLVAVNPDEAMAKQLLTWLEAGQKKLVLFGELPDALRRHLDIRPVQWPTEPATWSRSPPAPTYGFAASPAEIRYSLLAERLGSQCWHRSLERFDFTDEWNNLGYGAVRADGSMWALSCPVCVPKNNELAGLWIANEPFASYAGLFDCAQASILWFNRPVGPIDSFEWRLVENYISSYRHETLPCYPVIREIPSGYDAAITMRLDCDEDVESARPLWQAYQDMGVPFSLAVHTTNLADSRHYGILQELATEGGSVLSHTATHAPNWGGSYEAALNEAMNSAEALQAVTGMPVRYAVSPFHQTPPYALAALVDAGYQGGIGGIIRNDPEFLMARGGHLANLPEGFVGHSQQCMLHGDCMLAGDNPLRVFKQAFDQAKATNTLFGYLDHPFSERYAYGWRDESTRIESHRQFVAYIRSRARNPLFLNENDALDFLRDKAAVSVTYQGGGFRLSGPLPKLPLAVEYRGECRPASADYWIAGEGSA